MATLRASTGETVQLAVLDGLESVYVDRLESPHTVRIFARVGTRLPAPTTSTGKVLLAALPPDELDVRLRAWTPRRITPYTIVDEPDAARAAAGDRRAGVGGEPGGEPGGGGVGRARRCATADGTVIAALSVAAPADRAGPAPLRRIRAAVIEAARVVSRRLGAP